MECLVKPLKTRNLPLLAAYQAFFRASFVEVVPVTSAICDVAAQIRADENFKPLDALHLAAALDSGCRAFLTNDRRLARFSRLTVEAVT
jgi:predicted nucleic acid-binding protein